MINLSDDQVFWDKLVVMRGAISDEILQNVEIPLVFDVIGEASNA